MIVLIGIVAFTVVQIGIWTPLGLAPMVVAAGVLAVPLYWWRMRALPHIAGYAVLLIGVFILWSAVSLLWTLEPGSALRKLGSLGVMIVIGVAFVFSVREFIDRPFVAIALTASLLIAVLLVCLEKFAGAPLYGLFWGERPAGTWLEFLNRYNRGMTVIALLAWPAARAAGRYHPAAAVLLIASVLGLSGYMNSAAAIVALVLGSVVWCVVWLLPRYRVPELLGAIAAATIILMPAAVDLIPGKGQDLSVRAVLPESAYHRILIWQFTNDRIEERQIVGWGFDASRAIPGRAKNVGKDLPALPLHPHNAALQWRLELGIPGVMLGALLVFVLFRHVRAYESRPDRAVVAAMLTSGVTIALLSYGIWQSWWVAALLFAAAFAPTARRTN